MSYLAAHSFDFMYKQIDVNVNSRVDWFLRLLLISVKLCAGIISIIGNRRLRVMVFVPMGIRISNIVVAAILFRIGEIVVVVVRGKECGYLLCVRI